MMKTRSDLDSALALLDDPSDPLSPSAWTQLTRERVQKPQAKQPQTKAPATPAPKPTENKVFRATDTTLRQMMNEYNRRTIRMAPIQKPAASAQELSQGFRFDRVAFIQIPSIPGRVLRPATAPDDADT